MRSDCARCASTISRSLSGSAVWPNHVRNMMPCLSIGGFRLGFGGPGRHGPLACGGDAVDPFLALAPLALGVLVLVEPRGDQSEFLELVQFAVDLAEGRRPVEELQTPVRPALHVEAGQFLTERQQAEHRVARRPQARVAAPRASSAMATP